MDNGSGYRQIDFKFIDDWEIKPCRSRRSAADMGLTKIDSGHGVDNRSAPDMERTIRGH